MSIKSMHIFTRDGEENILNFSDSLTFIYGNFGTGKSTMLNLIMYGLGGNLIHTPAINQCLEAVQVDVILDEKLFRFFRKANTNRIQVDCVADRKRISLHYTQISSFLYEQASLPDLYLAKGTNEDRKVKLSFANFCWFSYLRQLEMDNSFFQLDSDNIYKQNAAINVLFTFFESNFLFEQGVNQKYRDLKRRLRQYENGIEIFRYLESIFYSEDIIEQMDYTLAIEQVKREIDNMLHNMVQYDSKELYRLLDMQKMLDQLVYRRNFEKRRKRYNDELSRLQEELAENEKRIRYDESIQNPNVRLLYDYFLECLISIGFHGVTRYDTVYMDQRTYMPIIYNPYEKKEVSFENLGSGGKRTLFKICFALAIHRLQHAKSGSNYLPSFLIIDTPMKNISEREDKDMYNNFYQYLFNLFSTELSDTQLFVVDKEKRDLTGYKFHENVTLIRMTHDEGANPPLFKNYTEIRGGYGKYN